MFILEVNNTISEVNIAVCLHFYFSIFLHFCTHFATIYSHFLLNIHILSVVRLFLCLFTVKRRFLLPQVALGEVADV